MNVGAGGGGGAVAVAAPTGGAAAAAPAAEEKKVRRVFLIYFYNNEKENLLWLMKKVILMSISWNLLSDIIWILFTLDENTWINNFMKKMRSGKIFGKHVINEKMILNTWWSLLMMSRVFLIYVWMLNLFLRGNDLVFMVGWKKVIMNNWWNLLKWEFLNYVQWFVGSPQS